MREIKHDGLPEFVMVLAEEETTNLGGAPNLYSITDCNGMNLAELAYQSGVILKDDDGNLIPNGILDECLMVILIDRL